MPANFEPVHARQIKEFWDMMQVIENGQWIRWDDDNNVFEAFDPPLFGDVNGPGGSTTGNIPEFTNAGGKHIGDSGIYADAIGRILIARQYLDPADGTFDFSGIPGIYQALEIDIEARSDRASASADGVLITMNNDTGNNYTGRLQWFNGSASLGHLEQVAAGAPVNCTFVNASTSPANWFSFTRIFIPSYRDTNKYKTWQARGEQSPLASGNHYIYDARGMWLSTSAITRVKLFPQTGTNFKRYSVASLYGVP